MRFLLFICSFWVSAQFAAAANSAEKVSDDEKLTKKVSKTIDDLAYWKQLAEVAIKGSEEDPTKSVDRSLKYLDDEIIGRVNQQESPCENIYFFTCSQQQNENKLDKWSVDKKNFEKLQNRIVDGLSRQIFDEDVDSFKAEKKMFQDCFELDQSLKSQTIVDLVLEKVIPFPSNQHYLTVEAKLMSEFGLGHTFFNIIKRELGGKQTIWLEPPKFLKLLKSINYEVVKENLKKYVKVDESFRSAVQFFDDLIQITQLGSDSVLKMNISTFVRDISNNVNELTEIEWRTIISKEYEKYSSSEIEKSFMVVNQMEYFQKLESLLQRTFYKRADKVAILALGLIYNNLEHFNYFNFEAWMKTPKDADLIELYCMRVTDLYSASYELFLREFKNGSSNLIHQVATKTVKFVKNWFLSDFFISENLSEPEKERLKYRLQNVTALLFDESLNEKFVEHFYQSFALQNNFFFNVINYNKNVRQAAAYESKYPDLKPFSIVHTQRNGDPNENNDLLIKIFLEEENELLLNLRALAMREYVYGTFGSEMARYIYDIMNAAHHERTYRKPENVTLLSSDLYSMTTSKKDSDDDLYAEVIALNVAYNAMKRNYLDDMVLQEPLNFGAHGKLESGAMFVLSYAKAHCTDYDGYKMNRILKNFKEFDKAFHC